MSVITNKSNIYKIDNKRENNTPVLKNIEYTDIDEYKEYLKQNINVNTPLENFCVDFNVIMCFCGNDFVKSFLFSTSNSNHTINKLLMPVYEGVFDKLKTNLMTIKNKKININNEFFKMIIKDFAKNEDRLYKNYYKFDIDSVMSGKKKQRDQEYDSEFEKQISILEHTPIHSSKNTYLYKKYIKEFTKIKYNLPHKVWKKQYYKYYFDIDITKSNSRKEIVNIVKEYIKSILWVQYYYFIDCPSWSWYYKYRTTPLPSDILNVLENEVKDINELTGEFVLGKPYTPFQQLIVFYQKTCYYIT